MSLDKGGQGSLDKAYTPKAVQASYTIDGSDPTHIITYDKTGQKIADGTDGIAALNAAFALLASTGGLVHFRGVLVGTTQLVIPAANEHDIILEGEGILASTINTHYTGYAISVTGGSGLHMTILRNFHIYNTAGKTGGVNGILTGNASGRWLSFEHLTLENLDVAMRIDDINSVTFNVVQIDNCNIGMYINSGADSGANHFAIEKVIIGNCSTYGVEIYASTANNAEGLIFRSCNITSCGVGVYVDPTSGIRVLGFDHCYFETNTTYDVDLNVSGSNFGQCIDFHDCRFVSVAGTYNVHSGTALVDTIKFDTCSFTKGGSQTACVFLTSPNHVIALNNYIDDTTFPFCNHMEWVYAPKHCNARNYTGTWWQTENSGTSTGTGAQQTIAHGCAHTPTYDQVFLSERTTGGALARQTAVPDATNIYITATNAKDYNWQVKP